MFLPENGCGLADMACDADPGCGSTDTGKCAAEDAGPERCPAGDGCGCGSLGKAKSPENVKNKQKI